MTKGKKILVACTVAFLCILIVFTFLSKSIQNAMLPVVEVDKMHSNDISVSYTVLGSQEYAALQKVRSQQPLKIVSVLKKVLREVEVGTPLLEVDISGCLEQVEQYEISILQLEAQLENLSSSSSQYEILQKQLAMQQAKLEKLKASFPEDGIITAPISGTLQWIQTEVGMTLPAESVLAEIRPHTPTRTVQVSLPVSQGERFEIGDRAMVSPSNSIETYKRKITEKRFDEATSSYVFSIEMDPEDFVDGLIFVELIKNYGYYDFVVPLSAVIMEGGDSYSIYTMKTREGLFGEETYAVKTPVVRIIENSLYMAVDGAFNDATQVIVQASGSLTDGMTVRVER